MPTVPKPPKSTPQSRRVERQKRERSPFKTYAAKKPPKPLGSRKAGVKPLERKRKIGGRVIKGVSQRTGLKVGTKLKVVGKRGQRLAPGDRKAAASIKGLGCICGCLQEVAWGHLQTRAIESTRHEEWASVPVCATIHPGWLDQGRGVKCREELFDLAKALGRRLTHEDAYPLLSRWGYYTWIVDKRTIL